MPPAGDLAHSPAALTWNQTNNLLVCRPALSPLSHTIQGYVYTWIKFGWKQNAENGKKSLTLCNHLIDFGIQLFSFIKTKWFLNRFKKSIYETWKFWEIVVQLVWSGEISKDYQASYELQIVFLYLDAIQILVKRNMVIEALY